MNFDDISSEVRAKAQKCKTPEEILELAKEAGYELSDEELEAVSGGDDSFGWCGSLICDNHCYEDGCFSFD